MRDRRLVALVFIVAIGLLPGLIGRRDPSSVAAQANRSGNFAVFAFRNRCGVEGPVLVWSGDSGRVDGAVHSNGGINFSGNRSDVTGATTYVCVARITGDSHTFGSGPTRGGIKPPPVLYTAASFPCTFTVAGTDLGTTGPWWVGGNANSRKLRDGVYCTTGRLNLGGDGVDGRVTFVATGPNGRIHLSGSDYNLRAHTLGVLAFSEGTGDAINASGSDGTWTGVLYAPHGSITLTGLRTTSPNGLVLGQTVRVSGSGSRVTGMSLPVPNIVGATTGAIIVQTVRCHNLDISANVDWYGQCTRPVPNAEFGLGIWNGRAFQRVRTGTTGRDGGLRFGHLDPGTYRLRQLGESWCFAKSDGADPEGEVTVRAGHRSTVWVFNCEQTIRRGQGISP